MMGHLLGKNRSGERGSTILIVLALLSILVLLATTLAFTSRIDVLSSRNFARSIQSRTAAVTGLNQAALAAFYALPQNALGEGHLSFESIGTNDLEKGGEAGNGEEKNGRLRTSMALSAFSDASARVNLNTAGAEVLERLMMEVAGERGMEAANARQLAERIAAWRFGEDGAPGTRNQDDNKSAGFALNAFNQRQQDRENRSRQGTLDGNPTKGERLGESVVAPRQVRLDLVEALQTGEDSPDEYIADIRYPSFGDDRRFQAVSDLMKIEGMTPDLVVALEPHVTVFSVSRQQVETNGRLRAPLDANRATSEEIYEGLKGMYGEEKEDDLLRQFAVNIVDARDEDRRPTVLESSKGDNVLIGFERTPRLSEIYPDSVTDDHLGDDGQYVEIYNPWPDSISLAGWRLTIGGRNLPLSGTIPSRGFLIVTDDYDNSRDSDSDLELEGQGSFYDVFLMVENGVTRRVLEIAGLDIPHSSGRHHVELQDETGALVDRFDYTVPGEWAQRMSFQRPNVLVGDSVVASANPFSLHLGESGPANVAERLRRSPQDMPFISPLELFDVFAGYAGSKESRWAFPVVASPASTSEEGRSLASNRLLLDARVIDLFVVEMAERRDAATIARERSGLREDGELSRSLNPYEGETRFENGRDLEAALWDRFAERPIGMRHGRVNINTAPKPVLVALGFTPQQAESMMMRRAARERQGRDEDGPGVLYERLSDVLVDEMIWGRQIDRDARLRSFSGLYDAIAVGSRAFLVEGQAMDSIASEGPKKSGTRARALVAMDNERPEIVSWRFVH